MKPCLVARTLLLSSLLAVGALATPALAQISFNISLAPPEVLYETVPTMTPGYVWAPGYWAWHGDRHIWVRGRTIVQRPGYRWEPDRWEQRGVAYYRYPGRWERDTAYLVVKANKEKKPKHWGNAGGNGGKPGKDRKKDR